jgi:hypothetical protein
MVGARIKGRHWRDPLVDPTDEEAATILQNNGLRMSGMEKMRTEYFERMQSSPAAIYASPLPKEAWRQIAERIKAERAPMSADSRAYEDAGIALFTAQNMEHGTSLWDAMVIQCECCEKQFGMSRREAQYILRHNGYIVVETYAGRNVG